MPVEVKRVSRDTLYWAVGTTATILVWIGLAVMQSLTRTNQPEIDKNYLLPVPTGLNQEVITDLKQRKNMDITDLKTVTESGKRVSMEEASPTPAATGAGSLGEQ